MSFLLHDLDSGLLKCYCWVHFYNYIFLLICITETNRWCVYAHTIHSKFKHRDNAKRYLPFLFHVWHYLSCTLSIIFISGVLVNSDHVEKSLPTQAIKKKQNPNNKTNRNHVTWPNEDFLFFFNSLSFLFYMLLRTVFQIFYLRNCFTLAH